MVGVQEGENQQVNKTGKKGRSFARAAVALMSAAVLAGALCGCRPTDFFTEVVISPFAEAVDWDNPDKTIVNSPDATKETGDLSALDWTEESPRSEEVENLVIYSHNPNTDMQAHHSIYDPLPLFAGIDASDGVRLDYSTTAELDEQTDAEDEQEEPEESPAQSTGGNDNNPDAESVAGDAASSGQTSGNSGETAETDSSTSSGKSSKSGGKESGEGADGNTGEEEGGDSDSGGDGDDSGTDNDGNDSNNNGSFGGTIPEYTPSEDRFSEPQHADKMAVLGSDAATLVQIVGGKDAICAMSDYAYNGKDSSGNALPCASAFKDVFSDEFTGQILWDEDGNTKGGEDLKDVSKLVDACGNNGVIVYDQRLGDQTQLFSETQRTTIASAGIQLVPVDLSTVQGIIDADVAIGKVLSESGTRSHGKTSTDMAQDYRDALNEIVYRVAATHGGTLAGNSLLTSYKECPVSGYSDNQVRGYIAIDSQTGLTYTGTYSEDIQTTRIMLFAKKDSSGTPLAFWEQAGGVYDGAYEDAASYSGYEVIWPLMPTTFSLSFSGSVSGAFAQWKDDGGNAKTFLASKGNLLSNETGDNRYGLGSTYTPYLIVCPSRVGSVSEVKQLVVTCMETPGNPYYAKFTSPGNTGYSWRTTVGWNGHGADNPFLGGLKAEDVVLENPTGLVGEWTEGSPEGVLEAAWIAQVYSKEPSGCSYEAITNMDGFSVSIGGETKTGFSEVVKGFYSHFYRYDLDSGVGYSSVVTDEGPNG